MRAQAFLRRDCAVIHCPFPTLRGSFPITVTRGWTVGFQEVTGLNPFSGLMKPPD